MPDAVRHATRSAALTALEIGQSVLVVVPVSYTHLDVYKRQPFTRTVS